MDSHDSSLSRRQVIKGSVLGATAWLTQKTMGASNKHPIRLGAPLFEKTSDPQSWIQALRNEGFSAAYCPVNEKADDREVKAYAKAARKANIVIAEVGAWSNPLSQDEKQRQAALTKCRNKLALADRIGARCCVNISGSRGTEWAGPDEKNLTQETFDMIVEVTRGIIDAVKPTRTYFTLEAMPWAYPDTVDSYLRLLKAIDRERFAVHLDPVNMVNNPSIYYHNGAMIRDCFAKLGPYIKSCHAKDTRIDPKAFTLHLDEIRPGQGELDYAVFLRELSQAGDIPLMLEHLPNAEEYRLGAEHIRGVARSLGLPLVS